MNIRNVHGQGNVDRTGERAPARTGDEKTVLIPTVARDGQDEATISRKSRDTLAALDGLAERARAYAENRSALVAAAQARLERGELGDPAVLAETARRLAASDFVAG